MSDNENEVQPSADLFARLSAIQTVVMAIVALFALAGLMLVGKGFYVKAKDEVAQYLLQRNFDARHRPATGGELRPNRVEAVGEAPGPLITGSVER
ncbi:hypothetical protein C7U60_13770 [Mesorhizobium plurifarium]|uniref:membrane protein n=1 Tax=Sinorhizobium arboris TaxID=76745 RepID=UPI0003FB0DB2|nr:membrane protein [Sinorhizobium arboris]PST22287.1 hypothetical protein C7U60_13770 [Mesorhizobium plurifarium]